MGLQLCRLLGCHHLKQAPPFFSLIMPGCGKCCCKGPLEDCAGDQCNCRCGESMCVIGVVVALAACVFYGFGILIEEDANSWFSFFHEINLIFFWLAGIMVVGGIFYSFCARGKKAFQRERSELAADTAEAGESQAPIPYIMLA